MVYLDNAATTKMKDSVIQSMLPFFNDNFGNASSTYTTPGQNSRSALENARAEVAKAIGAESTEIYFTSGGSEADNWAIKGICEKNKKKGNHIITTTIEHHAILHTCEYMEKQGYRVTYLPVDEFGMVSVKSVEEAICEDTVMVSIMFANNEIGTINPIGEIGALCREKGVIFHTDAVQATGAVPINVKEMNIDLLSMSSHKFHGPKGVGALYIRKGVQIENLIHGGAQEKGKRATTENVAGIVGMATALKEATENMEEKTKKITYLRDKLINEVLSKVPYTRLNGHREKRLPNNTSFCFKYIEGESLLLSLDIEGFVVSSGSACTSGSLDPSHVLLGIGLPHETAHGSLRATLSEFTTEEEIDSFVAALIPIVQRLRDMSPLYEELKKGMI
ncbi:MAG: cysteine desulfurase NifS [Clostridia bacterium]|nr:cysteine desulfurase NifS [Clostridia bacterium]